MAFKEMMFCPACAKSSSQLEWVRNNEETACPLCGYVPDEEELQEIMYDESDYPDDSTLDPEV